MATYVDTVSIMNQLRAMGITGDIFWVDTAGNDANPGTYALPCLTIDHAVGLCVAYHNDAVVVTDTLFNNYDENVNVDGVKLDVAGMTLIGIGNDIVVTNSNGGATSVMHITQPQVNVFGFNMYGGAFPSLHNDGGDWGLIGRKGWKTTLRGATGGTGVFHEEGSNTKYQYIDIDGVSTGMQLQDVYCEVHHCDIKGDNAGGSTGITLDNPGVSNWNYIHDNSINNFALGIYVAITARYNIFLNNGISCFLAASDANASNLNAWLNQQGEGKVSRYGLVQDDLASIHGREFAEADENISGTYWFVSTNGSDANGKGTWALPFASITRAMTVAGYGDTILCLDTVGLDFDENTGVTGLQFTAGVTVKGVGMAPGVWPAITNTNVGATSVAYLGVTNARLTGFHINIPNKAGCDGVVINSGGTRLDHCHIEDVYGVGDTMVYLPGGTCRVDNNEIQGGTTGIEVETDSNDIHDNDIRNCDTAVKFTGTAATNRFRHNYLHHSLPVGTVAVDVAGTCGVNEIIDNNITGYPANAILASTNWEGNLPPLDVKSGVDSQLTVANGTGTITIAAPTIVAIGRFKGVTLIINGAYAAGANGSFKANAAASSYLEAWIEIQTPNDANWRRTTPSTDNYRLYQDDTHDCLIIDNVNGAIEFRVRAALSAAPNATIDLDWQVLTDQ